MEDLGRTDREDVRENGASKLTSTALSLLKKLSQRRNGSQIHVEVEAAEGTAATNEM